VGIVVPVLTFLILPIYQNSAVFYEEFIELTNFLLMILVIYHFSCIPTDDHDNPAGYNLLDPAEHPELTERDIEFLQALFRGDKFQHVAHIHGLHLSTVQNRMCQIYQILGVADKTELIVKYSGLRENENRQITGKQPKVFGKSNYPFKSVIV
jgi:hypothetical protein